MTQAVPDLVYEVRDGLGILTFDRPDSKVNLLTSTVMLGLDQLLTEVHEAARRGEVRTLLIRSGKQGNFIAGADISELAALDDRDTATEISRRGQEILMKLEQLPVPAIVAIDGTCLGGGLELSLACDHRLACDHPRTRLGLPETRLGILPGLGGTVRAPRLIGLRAALDLILSGKQLDAQRARKIGLVHQLLPSASFAEDALKVAQGFARIGKKPLRRRSLLLRLEDSAPARWLIQRLTRRAVLARTRGHYPALPLALDVTVSGLGLSSEKAYQREAAAFGKLAVTPECKNLIAVFQLTEGARKNVPAGNAAPIRRAAVVGAGVMGAGIAELFAYQTVPVQVVDIDEPRVQAGISRARELLKKAAARASWSEEELRSRSSCLRGATGYDGFERVDIVVEAVVERMDVKRKVVAQIESKLLPDATIASNTSALSVSELQENLEQPGRVCGLHFFNPPHRMPLVEVVRGALTSDDTLATAFNTAIRLGKTPVVVKDLPGFVVNRILAAYLTEAGHLFQSGMTVQQLDGVMQNFGMPVGPARLLDEIGLDVVAEVSQTMINGYGERFRPAPVMGRVLATGVTGRKGGRGFYEYEGSKSRGVNKQIERVLRETASGEKPSASDAGERMVLSMINEASRILDDGVVGSVESLDVAMIMGTGFPPFRGGLLRYADALGLSHVVERLRHFAGQLGPRFEPAPGLLQRRSFYTAE